MSKAEEFSNLGMLKFTSRPTLVRYLLPPDAFKLFIEILLIMRRASMSNFFRRNKTHLGPLLLAKFKKN